MLQFCFVRFENFITKRQRLAYTVLVLMGTNRFTNWKALPVVLYLFTYQVHLSRSSWRSFRTNLSSVPSVLQL